MTVDTYGSIVLQDTQTQGEPKASWSATYFTTKRYMERYNTGSQGISLKTLRSFTIFFATSIFFVTLSKTIATAFVLSALFFLCYHQKSIIRQLLLALIAFACAASSVFVYEKSFFNDSDIGQTKLLAATGLIVGLQTQEYYTIELQNDTFRYQSDADYGRGDMLWFTGKLQAAMPSPTDRNVFSSQAMIQGFATARTRIKDRSFDYDTWLMMKGRKGVIYEENSIKSSDTSQRIVSRLRSNILQKASQTYDEKSGGLALGLLIGDRSSMSSEQYNHFVDSGLVHIIAVSGGNIVLLVVFASLLLFRIPFYIRTVLLLCIIIGYAMLVGSDSSILRATVMGVLTYVTILQGRFVSIRRLIYYAAILMLLRNPYYLIADVGFVFSFAALVGIIYLSPRRQLDIEKKNSRLYTAFSWFRNNYLTATLAASVGVLPFLLFFTRSYNLLSIIANAIVLPFVPLATIGGFLGLWGWGVFVQIVERICSYILYIAEFTTEYGIYLELTNGRYSLLVLCVMLLLLWFLSQPAGESS